MNLPIRALALLLSLSTLVGVADAQLLMRGAHSGPPVVASDEGGDCETFICLEAVSGAENYRLFYDTDSGAPYRYHCDIGNVTSIATKADLPASCEPLVDGTWNFNIAPIDDQGFAGALTTEDAGNVISGLKTACNSTLSAGAAIGTAISSATAGNIICLNDGSYSGFTLASVVKSPRVRVRALNIGGANLTSGVSFTGNTNGITLDGLDYVGGVTNLTGASITNITLRNFDSDYGFNVDGPTLTNANLLIEDGTLIDVLWHDAATSATIYVDTGTSPIVTIRNMLIEGWCSDGLQFGGAMILEDSVIRDKDEAGGCDEATAHTDGTQVCCGADAGSGTIIRRNYYLNNVQMLTAFDQVGGVTIENNLFDFGTAHTARSSIEWYSDDSSIIRYNTLLNRPGGTGAIELNHKTGDPAGSGTQVYDNVAQSVILTSQTGAAPLSTASVNTNNAVLSGSSPNVVCTPVFVGGSFPSTFAGALLASGGCKGVGQGGIDPGVQFRNLAAVTGFSVNP